VVRNTFSVPGTRPARRGRHRRPPAPAGGERGDACGCGRLRWTPPWRATILPD